MAAAKPKGKATEERTTPSREVTTTGKAGLPAASSRAARLAADAGKGVSQDANDKLVPMIKVLQAQSPQCLRQKPEFVKGAEAGDFFLKGMPAPVVKGADGLEFQPCAFMKVWLEFDGDRDDNPQFMGRRLEVPKEATLAEDGYDYEMVVGKKTHRFTFSREHYGLINGKPFVFPFGGSGHTTSREWQTLMDQFQLPDGRPEPSFNRKYRLTTVPKTNASGDWYGVRIEEMGEVTDEEYDRGLSLHNAVMAGTKVAEAPEQGTTTQGNNADI